MNTRYTFVHSEQRFFIVYLFSFSFTYLRKINKKENKIMKEKEKRTVYIDGLMMGNGIGDRCDICLRGMWYHTSPIVSYFAGGGTIIVETQNTVYSTKPVYEVDRLEYRGFNYWVHPVGSPYGLEVPSQTADATVYDGVLTELRCIDRIFRLKTRRFA